MIGSKTYLQKKLNANFWGVFYKLKGGGVWQGMKLCKTKRLQKL
jgi:hypothetical protein